MKYLKSFKIFERFNDRSLDYSTTEWNIIYSPDKFDDDLTNVQDSAVAYWEETKSELDLLPEYRIYIPYDKVLYTTQEGVDKNIVDNMSDKEYDEGDIVLVKDKEDRLWVLNGHHRLCKDRSNKKDSLVYLIDEDGVDFINRIIYGEGDEDY
jgi:hypothetical protein